MKLRNQVGAGEQIIWEGRKGTKVSILEGIFNPMLIFAAI